MHRLFVAIALPESVSQRLAMLTGGVPGARWVPPENYHLTLRFLGDVDGAAIPDIAGALARIDAAAFAVDLEGVGFFGPPHKPRTLWVGARDTAGHEGALTHLHHKVDRAVVAAGLAPDERKFAPHVTLAYLKDPNRSRVGRWLQAHGLFRAGPLSVESIQLFESRRGSGGSVYVPLEDVVLARGQAHGLAHEEALDRGDPADRL